MAHFIYSPADPFEAPPVGGLSYIAIILPAALPNVHINGNTLRLDGASAASISYVGSDFGLSVVGGVPDVTAGTITSLNMRYEGRPVLKVTGLNVDAEAMFNFLQVDNYIGYFNLIAKGHDRVDGTGLADALTGWTGNDTIYGGGGSDSVDGYNGKDLIYGGGSADTLAGQKGQDTLIGGKGADVFLFNEAPGLANHDVIRDFKPGVDKIHLDVDLFAEIGPLDDLAAESFRTGSAAVDGDDRILYQKSTGWVFYDPDGSGGAAKIAFARVTAGLTLTASDFVVID
jgi:Ca2+-binding RTX toxin-like protein